MSKDDINPEKALSAVRKFVPDMQTAGKSVSEPLASHLDKLFDAFKDKIVQVNFTQSFTKSVSDTAFNKLRKECEIAKEQDRESSITKMTNMICKDILKNQKIVIGFKDASYSDSLQILQLQHNRQYQWLLAEAYEAFENYLINLYAYSGYLDNDFWEEREFGKEVADGIRNQDLAWFIEQTRHNHKNLPAGILKQVNKKIPSLAQILASRKRGDPLNIDYEFTIILVSKLRHKIVHSHGYANKKNFIKSRLKEFPLANKSSAEKQDYIDAINSLFGNGQLENLIVLLEVSDPTIKSHIMLGDLLARITSYAMLIHNLVSHHLNQRVGLPLCHFSTN